MFVCIVVVMFEIFEVEILEIKVSDLKIDMFCFFGVGG